MECFLQEKRADLLTAQEDGDNASLGSQGWMWLLSITISELLSCKDNHYTSASIWTTSQCPGETDFKKKKRQTTTTKKNKAKTHGY